jgi:hypothetical protein
MDLTRLADMIAEGTRDGYASGNPDMEVVNPDGSRTIIYKSSDGHWNLTDTWYGDDPYIGTVVVSQDGCTKKWVMQYRGRIGRRGMDGMLLNEFLLRALRAITPDFPYRGPATFHDDGGTGLYYTAHVDGTLEWFMGVEEMAYSGAIVYRGTFQGGIFET